MSWTRLDDRWCERPVFDGLSYAARWHYLAMVQYCSRTERVDGAMTEAQARRVSDVDDPEAVLAELLAVGLVTPIVTRDTARDGHAPSVRLPLIAEHIPPPYVRNAAEAARDRKRRERAHRQGDHALCLPDHCSEATDSEPDAAPGVTRPVTRDIGTGQDRAGQAAKESETSVTAEPVTGCRSCGASTFGGAETCGWCAGRASSRCRTTTERSRTP